MAGPGRVLLVVTLLPRLCVAGLLAVALGGAGDLAYHLLPGPAAAALEPLLGPGAWRAHLLTLIGMLLVGGALLQRGLGHAR